MFAALDAERASVPMNETPQPRPGIPRELLIVAGVALAAALTMILIVFGKQGVVANAGDPYEYSKIARGFVEHGFDKLTRRAAMLYPHLLWLIYELGGGDNVVRFLHVLFHMGTCSLVFLLGRKLFNTRTGLFAGLFTAVNPMMLRYVADMHTECLLVFMVTLTVWLAVRFHERPTVPNGILLGFVGMLAVLTKGVALPIMLTFSAVWVVRWLLRRKELASPILGLVAMALTMAVVVTPWAYRNYKVTGGRFVPLTPGMPDAFLRGYIFTRWEFITLKQPPYTDAENESNALFKRIAKENGTVWELDEVQDDVNNNKEMKRMIREHPFLTVRKVFVGMFTFWYEMTSLKNSLVPFTLALVSWVLAFQGFRRARREKPNWWLVLVPVLALNCFVALLVPLGRYSVPILPCLAILAAFGVDTLLQRRAAQQQPALDLRAQAK
jgi:4-amino-4-deoxy-L-arabinose transferase-like glycosyltransferase